jgi:hypothetical protein
MQANQEYDLSKPLATAIKAKAPFVGIPMPGYAPLTLCRAKLAAALRGVKPLDIRVEVNGDTRWLIVEGIASEGRVRTCMKMISTPAAYWKTWQGKEALAKWKESVKPKAARVPKPKNLDRAVTVIKRLQKELDNMGPEYTLRNPCLLGTRHDPEYDSEWGESESERRAREVADWKTYHATRRMRGMVGALACRKRHAPSRDLYNCMRERGWEFTGYSEVRQPAKEKYAESYYSYLKELWRFVRGTGSQSFIDCRKWRAQRVSESPVPTADDPCPVWGPARYQVKLEDMRARQSLQAQIEAIGAEVPAALVQAKVQRLESKLKKQYWRTDISEMRAELQTERQQLEAQLAA